MTLDELRDKRDRLSRELEAQRKAPSASRQKVADIERGLADLDRDIEHRTAVRGAMERAYAAGRTEAGIGIPEKRKDTTVSTTTDTTPGAEARSAAFKAIDEAFERSAINEPAGLRLRSLVERDKFGSDAKYIAAISDPAYEKAFANRMTNPDPGPGQLLSPEEAQAIQRVAEAMQERAMLIGEPSTGGYAVPVTLDPTIMLDSDGALSPLRELATVTSITSSEWKGIASEGVKAEFAEEGSEVKDGSPELEQPKAKPERAHQFVPFSFELGQDWPSLSQELAKLFSDAKDQLEAEKFLSGKGPEEGEPEGLLVGATKTVPTKTKEALAADDVYSLIEALPPRFQARAQFLSSLTVANVIHRFSSPGGDEAPLFNDDRTRLLGKLWNEVSDMSAKSTTKEELVLAYGDIGAAFRIVDRIGMTVELVPHLFGENGRPTGERGLYCIWRTTSTVQIPNAVRVLQVKAE